MLKVIIVGTGEMASSLLLGVLEAGHKVVGFLSYEKIALSPIQLWIKNMFSPSDFYVIANSKKIPAINTKSVNSPKFRKFIRNSRADVVIFGSWGEKISKKTFDTPKIATINVHPSLLPKYRGANPYMMTISHGETMSGVTFHLVNEYFDRGGILLQKEVPILQDDTGYSLKLRTCQTARNSIKELFEGIENGSILPIEQDEKNATYYKRIGPKDILIDFNMGAREIYDKVRGFCPWAECYLPFPNKREFLKIRFAKVINLEDDFFIYDKKKYTLDERFLNQNAGKILIKNKNFLLCKTIDENGAILFEKPELYGFFKKFFTKKYLKNIHKFC